MDAPFCLKPAGTCEITSHKGRHPFCLGVCLLLRFTLPIGNEVALHPQKHSYRLEDDHADYDEGESEYERLNRMQLLFEWDERLRDCKKREAAFRCFMEFKGSAAIIREETRVEAKEYAKDDRERIQMESLGNGDSYESDGRVTDDDAETEDEEPVSKEVSVKSRRSRDSDLSFASTRKGGSTNDLVRRLLERVEGLAKNSSAFSEQVDAQAREIARLESHLSAVNGEMRASKVSFVRKDEVRGHKADIANLRVQEASNEHRLLEVTHNLAQATNRIEAMALVKFNAPVAVEADCKRELADLEGKVRAVEGKIYLIKNRLGADLVKFGNVDLKSLVDTYVFVKTKMPGDKMTFGCFYDMVAMLDSLMDSNAELSVFVKTGADASKSMYKNAAESRTKSSFNRAAHAIFSRKGGSDIHGGTMDPLFSAVKERALWTRNGGSQGMKAQLNRELGVLFLHVSESIVRQLGYGDAANIAQEYLTQSRKCYQEFINWSESFYLEIMDLYSVKPNEAWRLVLEFWGAFFEALRAVRGIATGQLSAPAESMEKDRAERTS